MSKGSRIAIGLVALIAAYGLWIQGQSMDAGFLLAYGLTAFCVVIAIACFFPKSHAFTLRVIGAGIFSGYAWYLFDSFSNGEPSRALLGFFIWGLPSGYLAIMGKYPEWGNGAAAFGTSKRKS